MITLEKVLNEMKAQSTNDVVGGGNYVVFEDPIENEDFVQYAVSTYDDNGTPDCYCDDFLVSMDILTIAKDKPPVDECSCE